MGFYYDLKQILSFNRIVNIIVGARGCGKTFSFKSWSIDDFLKTGARFIYMRRYASEFQTKDFKLNFIPEDLKKLFPEHEIKIDGNVILIDGLVAGYLVALSTAGQKKSIEYDKVNKVLFDEFIIDKSKYTYLPDETRLFEEYMETASRFRKVSFFLMANNVSFNNPYCLKWNVRHPQPGSEFFKTPHLVLHEPPMTEYLKCKLDSRLGKFLESVDKEYVDYAYRNIALRDNSDFIEHKGEKAKYFFTMLTGDKRYGIWLDRINSKMYVSHDTDGTCPFVFTFLTTDMKPNVLLMKGNRKVTQVSTFFECWKNGILFYETAACKMAVEDILRKTY
jgi:hypothetical protein